MDNLRALTTATSAATGFTIGSVLYWHVNETFDMQRVRPKRGLGVLEIISGLIGSAVLISTTETILYFYLKRNKSLTM